MSGSFILGKTENSFAIVDTVSFMERIYDNKKEQLRVVFFFVKNGDSYKEKR